MKGRGPGLLSIYLIPALLLWLCLVLGPALWGIYVSLTNEALTGPKAKNPEFVGLANYKKIIADKNFYNAILRSTIFVLGSAILGQAGLGFILALLTDPRQRAWKRIKLLGRMTTTLCFFAWVTPAAVVGYVWLAFLNSKGVLNQILPWLDNTRWLARYPMLSIILMNTWWGTGWSMLLFKAALESVPREILESAEVDGASGWRRVIHIIIPLIRGPAIVNLLLITIWTYGVFDVVFMLTGGGPFRRTELLTIYAYRTGFQFYEIGYGSAVSVAIFIITFVLSLFYYRLLISKGI